MVTTTYATGKKDFNPTPFAVTNWVEDVALVCTTDDAALGNVLGTLIAELINLGILKGDVATA